MSNLSNTTFANVGHTASRVFRLAVIADRTHPILARLAAQNALPAPLLVSYGLTAADFVIEPSRTDILAISTAPVGELVMRPVEPDFYCDFAAFNELGAVALTVHLETAALALREVAQWETDDALENEVAIARGVMWLPA